MSLFELKFWTFNLGDNRPTLEPVFGVEGRSTTVLTLRHMVFHAALLIRRRKEANIRKTGFCLFLFGLLSDRFLGLLQCFKLMIAVSSLLSFLL